MLWNRAPMDSMDLSPEEFNRLSQEILEIATSHLRELDSQAITPQERGVDLENFYHLPLPELGLGPAAVHQLAHVVRHSRVQNGRFFGYVLGSGDPAAAATEILCSILNQNVTAWRSSPAAVMIEHTVVNWLAQAIGCAGFQGTLTSGGSSANLMALAMAREAMAPANERGLRGG